MDQTTLTNQTLLWYLTQQRQKSNLDCRGRLRAHCDHQKRLGLQQNLYTILQVLSLTLFEKNSIHSLFENSDDSEKTLNSDNQLFLFQY